MVKDAYRWEVDPERDASKFDVRYYRKLLEKAWEEAAFVFFCRWLELLVPRRAVKLSVSVLETANEILAGIFQTQSGEVEEMIREKAGGEKPARRE